MLVQGHSAVYKTLSRREKQSIKNTQIGGDSYIKNKYRSHSHK